MLIARLRAAVACAPVRYAVVGATAMAVHGYKRYTADVDIVVLEEDLNALTCAMRQAKLQVYEIAEPYHYAAKLPGDVDPERRIDILVPAGPPETTAAIRAVIDSTLGLKVAAPHQLALMKFIAYDDDPRGVKHLADLVAMYRRGIFSALTVREVLTVIEPVRVAAWDALVKSWHARPKAKPRRRK